jgi:hypothetical protein
MTTVNWERFENFFTLYEKLKSVQKLVYMIGETHHVYIGSVGCKGGEGGLAVRYDRQYVDRTKAIFGSDTPQNQPAFAGTFVDPNCTTCENVGDVEKLIQWVFLERRGGKQALFRSPNGRPNIAVEYCGDAPSFLRDKVKEPEASS